MLKDHSSRAIVAVSDMARARAFYRDTLGLPVVGEMGGAVLTFGTGATELVVYHSEFAGTNRANAVAWDVGDDIEAIVANLKAKGVAFEHYPDMDGEFDGAIHRSGGMRLVWIKDPDGNLLHFNDM